MTAPARPVLKRTTMTAVIGLAVLAACDDGPTRPSPAAKPPTPVTVVRLEMTGPDTLPPGESVQYSVVAHRSDGSTRDATSEAVWHSSIQEVLTIAPTGLATGHRSGETHLAARMGPTISTKEVIVVPTGTYRLTGTVRDAGYAVGGARIEITAGRGQGLASSTDLLGGYRVHGVAGNIEIRVNRSGFQDVRRTLQVTSHQTADFDLVLLRPRAEVSGTYVLTVSAGSGCLALPEHARRRSYNAVVTQEGPRLVVTLGGSRFYSSFGQTFNTFRGAVESRSVTFQVGSSSYYYGTSYEVIEELDSSTFLAMVGGVDSTVSQGRISGALYGWLEILQPRTAGGFETIASCHSTAHPFEFAQ
jgi:hypothetical protein